MFLRRNRRAEWGKDSGETPGHRGLLTWTGGAAVPTGHGVVPAGLRAGHLLTGNLSQLGEQKETGEKPRASHPPRASHLPRAAPSRNSYSSSWTHGKVSGRSCRAWSSPEQQVKPDPAGPP